MACFIGLLWRSENIIKVKPLVNFKQDVNSHIFPDTNGAAGKPQRSSKTLDSAVFHTVPARKYLLWSRHTGSCRDAKEDSAIIVLWRERDRRGRGEEVSGGSNPRQHKPRVKWSMQPVINELRRRIMWGRLHYCLPGFLCYWKGHISTGLSLVGWHSQPLTWPALSPWSKVLLTLLQ